MLRQDLVSWGCAISMYAQHCHQEYSTALFVAFRRASDGKALNKFLLASSIRACAQSKAAVNHLLPVKAV